MSRLTGPTYVNIIGRKMTALIEMLKLVKKSTDQKYHPIDNEDHILEASIILKRLQFKNLKKKRTEKTLKPVPLIMFAVDSN